MIIGQQSTVGLGSSVRKRDADSEQLSGRQPIVLSAGCETGKEDEDDRFCEALFSPVFQRATPYPFARVIDAGRIGGRGHGH